MSRPFPNRPSSRLSAKSGLLRQGGRLQRLVMGERLIISRELCHFETMPTTAGGQSFRRYEAAKLSAKARTPIQNPAFYFDWGQDQIGIWSWSKSLTEGLTDFEGEVLPETVLHPPLDNGARLVATIDGFEGQVWRNRQLIASRWWPRRPEASEWTGFLRASRVFEASADIPAPLDPVEFLDRPVNAQPYTALLDRLRAINWRDMTALALVFVVVPSLFFFGQWAHLSLTKQSLTAEVASLSEQTAEISAARQSAQNASNELTAYAASLNRNHPAALLASVSEELAQFSIRLEAFEQTDNRLTLNLRTNDGFAPEALVRAMESNAQLNNVSIEPGRGAGEWTLSARLEPVL